MPPAQLRLRVHGSDDFASFHVIGAHVVQYLDAVLEPQQPPVSNQARVLDFGCGCGRVLTHVKRRHHGWRMRMSGSDIDAAAIDWCRDHLSDIAEFTLNRARPALPIDARSVDLVYAISVFTHLPEDLQLEWLEELNRITRLGGLLLRSVHPMGLADAGARDRQSDGFVYAKGEGTRGLPDFYQTTFHSGDYVRSRWTKYFEIADILPRRINNHQDLVVARPREPGGLLGVLARFTGRSGNR